MRPIRPLLFGNGGMLSNRWWTSAILIRGSSMEALSSFNNRSNAVIAAAVFWTSCGGVKTSAPVALFLRAVPGVERNPSLGPYRRRIVSIRVVVGDQATGGLQHDAAKLQGITVERHFLCCWGLRVVRENVRSACVCRSKCVGSGWMPRGRSCVDAYRLRQGGADSCFQGQDRRIASSPVNQRLT